MITSVKARQLLGARYTHYTDRQVKELLVSIYQLVELSIDVHDSKQQEGSYILSRLFREADERRLRS